jgi:lipoprotein-releasing system ATP-binding protein
MRLAASLRDEGETLDSQMNSPPLLQLVDILFHYGPDAPAVLDAVNFSAERGDSIAVVGPSGCGKSTLLNVIGTLERPEAGQVLLDGEDVTQVNGRALAAIRNRKIGFIFQDHHLLPQCTLLENVVLPALAGHGVDVGAAQNRARQLLERVGLGDRMHHRPGEVSGGQRQRAAVVRALVNRPALLLADEPTGSLDRTSATALAELLAELNREEHVALIVVTHSAELAAKMTRQYELKSGRLVPFEC